SMPRGRSGPRVRIGAARSSKRQLREIAPTVEDERLRAFAARAPLDLADEDHMIAFFVAAAVETLEHRGGAVEHGDAACAGPKRDALETVESTARETLGQGVLPGGEDVDRVVRAARESRHRAGLARQAPENERRLDRDRVERVRGE